MENDLFEDLKCSLHEMALIIAAEDVIKDYIHVSKRGYSRLSAADVKENIEALQMALKHYRTET